MSKMSTLRSSEKQGDRNKVMKLLVFLCTFSTLALGAGEQGPFAQYNRYQNMVVNNGFENGLTGWTNSGSGSVSISTNGQGFGFAAAAWDAAANNDTFSSSLTSIPAGDLGQPCRAEFIYNGGDANITANVTGSAGLAATVTLSPVSTYTSQVLNFTCPSSSNTLQFQLKATANAAIIYLDQVYIGLDQAADIASVQTFTNKSLTSPILTTPAITSAGALFRDTSSGNTTLKAAALASGTLTLPAATDTLIGKATTDALTNKDYQGGTASNTSRLTVPKDTLANLNSLTRKQGTVVYDTTGGSLLVDDGTNLNAIGGGSGEKNYITAPSTASGWTASGAGVTVATVTTSIPRPNTTKTGFLVSRVSGSSAFAYANAIIDDADFNKKLKVQFDQAPNGSYVSGDQEVDVYSCTQAWSGGTCAGTSARLPLSTDSSSLSLLPNMTGTYRTTFGSGGATTKWIQVQFGLHAATASSAVAYSDVIVGPGTIVQGTASSEWLSFTPTGTWSTNSTYIGRYRRVGDSMQVAVNIALAGAPTSSALSVSMPSGFTIDTTKMIFSGATAASRVYSSHVTMKSAGNSYEGEVIYDTSTLVDVYVLKGDASSPPIIKTGNQVTQAVPATFASGDLISLDFTVPIAEWAGSGTVNLGQGDGCEYAYNTTTTDASDTTSFGYGQGGNVVPTVATSATQTSRDKRVRFIYPQQQGDKIDIEFQDVVGGSFNKTGDSTSYGVFSSQAGSTFYGTSWTYVNATDIDVSFYRGGRLSTGATIGAAGAAFPRNATDRWRVKKCAQGQATGFGLASGSVGSSGLVSYEDSGTFSASFTGARSTTDTIRFSRVGKTVTLNFPRDVSATCSASIFTATAAIPSALRGTFGATGQILMPVFVQDNSATATVMGMTDIYSNGNIEIYKSNASANFTNAANCGWYETSVSYPVN